MPHLVYSGYFAKSPCAGWEDVFVFSCYLYGTAICFLLSAIYHLINNHSKQVATFGLQLDYLGILALMWGAAIPSIYYGFFWDPSMQRLHWMIVTTSATACAITTLHPSFRHPSIRHWRATMYTCFGLSAIIFVGHGLAKYGWKNQKRLMALDWMLVTSCLNSVGAVSYSMRIPERWYPRQFDIFGAGHQISHIAYFFAALTHTVGLVRAFEHAHSDLTCK